MTAPVQTPDTKFQIKFWKNPQQRSKAHKITLPPTIQSDQFVEDFVNTLAQAEEVHAVTCQRVPC